MALAHVRQGLHVPCITPDYVICLVNELVAEVASVGTYMCNRGIKAGVCGLDGLACTTAGLGEGLL